MQYFLSIISWLGGWLLFGFKMGSLGLCVAYLNPLHLASHTRLFSLLDLSLSIHLEQVPSQKNQGPVKRLDWLQSVFSHLRPIFSSSILPFYAVCHAVFLKSLKKSVEKSCMKSWRKIHQRRTSALLQGNVAAYENKLQICQHCGKCIPQRHQPLGPQWILYQSQQ